MQRSPSSLIDNFIKEKKPNEKLIKAKCNDCKGKCLDFKYIHDKKYRYVCHDKRCIFTNCINKNYEKFEK